MGFKKGILAPWVGGVLLVDKDHGKAFVGGSNIQGRIHLPTFTNQRRPQKFSSIESFTQPLQKGIELKLILPNENKNATPFVVGFRELAGKLEIYGLDTVFKVPKSSWSQETYIAKD